MNNEKEEQVPKTFAEMGVVFTEGNSCYTCRDNSCHNIVPLKKTGEEYSVHISTDFGKTIFIIHASKQANTSTSDEISEIFTNETDAVKFVCDTFSGFKCF